MKMYTINTLVFISFTEGTVCFIYIAHYSVTEINPFHDGSVTENTTEQVN
jgi:hypothetical protein